MEIKKTPFENNQNTEKNKESRLLPKRSFSKVLASRNPLKQAEKKPSVFDMVSKKNKKEGSFSKKPAVDSSLQHGEAPGLLASTITEEIFSPSPISELSPEVSLLIEKMADFIVIESQNGITTTTVIVAMKGSILDGSQITLDHYDTAPHSFNLQLSGSPEGVDLLTSHLTTLQASIEAHQALQGFHVRILPPTLHENTNFYEKGKEKRERREEKEKAERITSKKKTSF